MSRYDTVIRIENIPPELKAEFKAVCASNRVSMRDTLLVQIKRIVSEHRRNVKQPGHRVPDPAPGR